MPRLAKQSRQPLKETGSHHGVGVMMSKGITVPIFLVCLVPSVWAQEQNYPKGEVFGTLSVLSFGSTTRVGAYGWQTSMNTNFTRSFGIDVDMGTQYKNGLSIRQSLFGPQLNMRSDKSTLFLHALAGPSHSTGSSGWTVGAGGGVDVNAGNRIKFRAFQMDWLPTHPKGGGEWSKNAFRFGFGVGFGFGKGK
jgi:hypothetical protein